MFRFCVLFLNSNFVLQSFGTSFDQMTGCSQWVVPNERQYTYEKRQIFATEMVISETWPSVCVKIEAMFSQKSLVFDC